ncbi:MAG: acylneuraminate cytidylyltransferase [Bacteroidia bacterium]|nr:acylneuraminate cytidylyltransferase [Bacteroidia bacterium]
MIKSQKRGWGSLLLMALSFFTTALQAQPKQADWANLKRYASENKHLAQPTVEKKRVIFMGNSITEGWVKTHPDFFITHRYIGRGISGQTSAQFLVRFREDVINLSPAVVIINAGTNDVAENTGSYHEAVTFGNILSMVELAQAHGIKVILSSVLPAEGFKWNPAITDAMTKIRSLNALLKAYANEHHLPYADYFSALVTSDGKALQPIYTNDSVHPTAEGYTAMERIIQPIIEEQLKP